MKPKIPCYVYKDGEFVKKCSCIKEAAMLTNNNPSSVGRILDGKQEMTRNGYVFSLDELTQEEMEHMPRKEKIERPTRFNNNCKEFLMGQEFEVDCDDRDLFYLERSKEARKMQLKQYIYTRLRYHFLTIPKKRAALERRFINDILESL